jgi:hypothetical protein
MASLEPQTPPLSPDGRYWWDGQAWQPLFTPDGMQRWSGRMWIPLATPYGQPPATPPVAAEKPEWLDRAPTWLESPPASAQPEPPPPAAEAAGLTPAWATSARPVSRPWIYMTGALLLVVVAIGAFYVRGQILAFQSSNASTIAVASPTPLLSEYERADRFLNIKLTPSLVASTDTLQAVEKNCTAALPPSCKDALIVTDKAMVDTEDVMYKGDIPPCIAREMRQLRDDWQGMEQGVALAISGYANSSRELTVQGLVRFAEIAQYVKPDMDRITKAEQTCPH